MIGILSRQGSWDRSIRYWDGRQNRPVLKHTLPERLFAGDIRKFYCVYGIAIKDIILYDLRKAKQPLRREKSDLDFQTRSIAIMSDLNGYIVSSIESRCSVKYFSAKRQNQHGFAFKCHRKDSSNNSYNKVSRLYAVNEVSFHPNRNFNTFSTIGSDGNIFFWDKDARRRLWYLPKPMHAPITCGSFNRNGRGFAYSVGYDWNQGPSGLRGAPKPSIYIFSVPRKHIQPKNSNQSLF